MPSSFMRGYMNHKMKYAPLYARDKTKMGKVQGYNNVIRIGFIYVSIYFYFLQFYNYFLCWVEFNSLAHNFGYSTFVKLKDSQLPFFRSVL